MIERTPQLIRTAALVGWLAAVSGGVGTIVVRAVTRAPILPNTFGLGEPAIIAFVVQGITFASVGALLVRRRPENAVGRVLVVCGAAYALAILAGALATFAVAQEDLEAASVAGWFGVALGLVGAASLPYLALIFPTGRTLNPRWERVRWFFIGQLVIGAALLFTQPGPLQIFPGITNPLGIGLDLRVLFGDGAVSIVTALAGGVAAPIAMAAVVVRYRAAGSAERQQLKWFISAAVASLAAFALTSVAALQPEGSLGELPAIVYGLTGAVVPVAIGIAILRSRLYEIDRLIARTVTYAAVTAVLGLIYAAVVVGVGALLGSFGQGSAVAVAAGTLMVFAVFGPVRRRAQLLIDRRFDRSRVDGAEALVSLRERLRYEVDANQIERHMLGVVRRVLHPVHASVWVRAPATAVARRPGVNPPERNG